MAHKVNHAGNKIYVIFNGADKIHKYRKDYLASGKNDLRKDASHLSIMNFIER